MNVDTVMSDEQARTLDLDALIVAPLVDAEGRLINALIGIPQVAAAMRLADAQVEPRQLAQTIDVARRFGLERAFPTETDAGHEAKAALDHLVLLGLKARRTMSEELPYIDWLGGVLTLLEVRRTASRAAS